MHDAPLRFFGFHIGTRMTAVRLPDGALWVHSPTPTDPELLDTLRSLGPIRHIVAPNAWHHLHVGPLANACERAEVHAPSKLRYKRKDLHIHTDLTGTPPASWGGELTPVPVQGTWLHETAFVHHPSRLLVTSDLLQNVTQCAHLPSRLWFRLGGVYGEPGIERPLRLLFRDCAKAQAGIDALLQLDFDGVVLAHGDVITEGGHDAFASSYSWL